MQTNQSSAYHQSLADAITWCTRTEGIITVVNDAAVSEHLESMNRARELFMRARQRKDPFSAAVMNSRDWKAGQRLITAAATVVESLTAKFRGSELAEQVKFDAFQPDKDWEQLIEVVARKRRQLVQSSQPDNSTSTRGRLLRYEPKQTVTDGASQYSSAGFFDVNDAPPCDTWVAFINGVLISWIPEQLQALAERGIEANTVNCIGWDQQQV